MVSNVDLNNDGPSIIGTALAFTPLAGLALALRFFAKWMIKAPYGLDDWFILAGTLLFFVTEGVEVWGIFVGLNSDNILDADFQTFRKSTYWAGNVYFISVTFINLSLLCFYRRIFTVPGFKLASSIIMVVTVLWGISGFFAEAFTCMPVKHFWDFHVKGTCIHYEAFFLTIMIVETLLDCVILALPIRLLLNLQLNKQKKMGLVTIFLLGGFVIITNIIRMISVYPPNGAPFSVLRDELWINLHVGTAIICSCLPTYRPLLSRAAQATFPLRHHYSSKMVTTKASAMDDSTQNSHVGSRSRRPNYAKLGGSWSDSMKLTDAKESAHEAQMPANVIEVKKTVEVV